MSKSLGSFGESWAVGLLTRHGYQVIARNVRVGRGELDIIALEAGEIVFVEVKCRRSSQFGSPEESITPARFERLARAAQQYLSDREIVDRPFRIDVVAIEVGPSGSVVRSELLRAVESPS